MATICILCGKSAVSRGGICRLCLETATSGKAVVDPEHGLVVRIPAYEATIKSLQFQLATCESSRARAWDALLAAARLHIPERLTGSFDEQLDAAFAFFVKTESKPQS